MTHYQAIIIGSGFAGAVTACRLAQAGVNVCILERGRRYGKDDFPAFPGKYLVEQDQSSTEEADYAPPPDFSRWLWSIDRGLWEVRDLDQVIVAQAAGYGGGSLIYANVHLRAAAEVFDTNDDARNRVWPADYSRKNLEKYYDLVAFMLDVKPIPGDHNLPKKKQFERAAQLLKDRNIGHPFDPPLAINFKNRTEGKNPWGIPQGECDNRGYCCFGCGKHAKNTLDLNYLAIAEDPSIQDTQRCQDQHKGYLNKYKEKFNVKPVPVHVKTLAEVTAIRRKNGKGYEVTYVDHLRRAKEAKLLDADFVFLCAGSVNSTELLLKNSQELEPRYSEVIGDCYQPNADSLAVVFDCDEVHELDRGPTITSSLIHDDGDEWLLIQDGGFPTDLSPLLGVFRSPLWARRNRYLELKPSDRHLPPDERESPEGSEKPDELELFRRRTASVPRPVTRQVSLSAAGKAMARFPQRSPLPPQLKAAFEADREQILDFVARSSEPSVRRLFDEISKLLDSLIEDRTTTLPGFLKAPFQDVGEINASRGLLRLLAQLIWGSEADMARHIASILVSSYANPVDRVRGILEMVLWAANYRPVGDHTGLLLAMGRDPEPGGKLLLRPTANKESRLQVEFAKEVCERSIRSTPLKAQEGLMRDIAKIWQGELRTNPIWTFGDRRFSVHNQGGCPMRGSRNAGVTDRFGEVYGCEGLYVMDAAAFPTSVGVNPAPTIAAIAEYKIENFIRTQLENPDWRAPEFELAKDWANNRHEMLNHIPYSTKIKKRAGEHNTDYSKPIGLKFKERMTGFLQPVPVGEKPTEEWENPDSLRQKLSKFDNAEILGIEKSASIEVELNVRINDLAMFLSNHEHGRLREDDISVEGNLKIAGWPKSRLTDVPVSHGSLQLFLDQQKSTQGYAKFLKYRLPFSLKTKQKNREEFEIIGVKIVQDDPRIDIWRDTATLYFELVQKNGRGGKLEQRGILRLPAIEFLQGQLNSMEVTGTTDPARQSWAMAAFGKFFLAQLADIYIPEPERVLDVIKNIVTKTHV